MQRLKKLPDNPKTWSTGIQKERHLGVFFVSKIKLNLIIVFNECADDDVHKNGRIAIKYTHASNRLKAAANFVSRKLFSDFIISVVVPLLSLVLNHWPKKEWRYCV